MNRYLMIGLIPLVACTSDVSISEQVKRMAVTPQVADAGIVAVGQSTTVTLQLDSLSPGDITVRAIDVLNIEGNFFTFDGEAPVIPGNETVELELLYNPTELGYHQARVTIVSDSKDTEIEVFVRGAARDAAASVWPPVLDFGVVNDGESKQEPLYIRNDGNIPLTLSEALFTDSAYSTTFAMGDTLLPGKAWYLPITFSPSSDTPSNSELTFDFGITGLLSPVDLRANDCENGTPAAYDTDSDGYTSCSGDCDDTDPDVHPGAEEVADGVDQDCDDIIDEGTEAYDDDGDGYTELEGDCNDGDETVNPSVTEDLTNGKDDDCDGVTDYGGKDVDGDGYAIDAEDCDDGDDTVYPGAEELADGIDNDCDGIIDEGTVDYDDDGDGMSESAGDCDDTDKTIYKGATEVADWQDNDCDGTVDEGTTNYDDDGDGYSELGGDCDDTNDKIGPATLEVIGDGIDNDCDGVKS